MLVYTIFLCRFPLPFPCIVPPFPIRSKVGLAQTSTPFFCTVVRNCISSSSSSGSRRAPAVIVVVVVVVVVVKKPSA